MKKTAVALGASLAAVLSLGAAQEPAWPATFAADYAQHVASVLSAGTTTDSETASAALAATCHACGLSAGYGSAEEPFDARFLVQVGTLPVRLANPSGFLVFVF